MTAPYGRLLPSQIVFLLIALLEAMITITSGTSNTESHRKPNTHNIQHNRNSSVETTTFLFDRTLMLERDKLVPDVLDAIPKEELFVSYYTRWINYGNLVGSSEAEAQPTVIDWKHERERYYTIILTGPDCPSRKNHSEREHIHWLVTNIMEIKFEDGDVYAEYMGAAPYVLDAHRFLFVVFIQPQPDKMHFDMDPIFDAYPYNRQRKKFSTRDFAKKHGLQAVAANYFWIDHSKPLPTFETWFRTPGDLTP